MSNQSGPTLDEIMGGRVGVRADEPVDRNRFIDVPLENFESFSKYVYLNGERYELKKEDSSHFSVEISYPIEEGSAKFKLVFGTSLINYQIKAMDSTQSISVVDQNNVSSILVEGEAYPISDRDTVYIGASRFAVSTREYAEGSRLRTLKLNLVD